MGLHAFSHWPDGLRPVAYGWPLRPDILPMGRWLLLRKLFYGRTATHKTPSEEKVAPTKSGAIRPKVDETPMVVVGSTPHRWPLVKSSLTLMAT